MKLLSIRNARSIWLGQMSDFNPRGIYLERLLFPLLANTFKFKIRPTTTEKMNWEEGIVFSGGEFIVDNDQLIEVDITLYNEGVMADTRSSTSHSDDFLEYLFSSFSEIFKGPTYQSVVKEKLYVSQVYVSTDKSLEILNPKLKQVSEYLKDSFQSDTLFETGGISFWPDQGIKNKPRSFTFERAVNVPFSENKYYSIAPLTTEKHLELLDKLEEILS